MTVTNLYVEKKECLIAILDRLLAWDDTLESAQTIIDENQQIIERVQTIDEQLTTEELAAFSRQYHSIIQQIMSVQGRLIGLIKKESADIEQQMRQMNQKSNVVSHYMSKNTSLFVDRDM